MKKRYTLSLTVLLFATAVFSQDCLPPSGQHELDINNVRARISNGLQHFQNQGSAGYQVPKAEIGQDAPSSIYADGLWIGGYTADGQLHLAGSTYVTDAATDYSAGPLQSDPATLNPDPDMCGIYDQVYRADRYDALLHHEYYTRLNNGGDITAPPFENGYTTPEYFYTWPGNNPATDYSFLLAPYYDFNADGIYNPEDGDYPGFDLFAELDCPSEIVGYSPLLGHQATWYVSNDLRSHSLTGGETMGLEVQVMNYAYISDDALNDATFVQYTIINRSATTYQDCHISKWVDLDIGCSQDDHVGTHVGQGVVYGYNGDALDEDCNGVTGYGNQLAAQGVVLLSGPMQDADGMDNPLTADLSLAESSQGISYSGQGRGYGDGLIDNERIGLRGSMAIAYDINAEPTIPVDYMRYMTTHWKNGSPLTYGGDGTMNNLESDYIFPGESDPLAVGTDGVSTPPWSEVLEFHEPGDRRVLLNTSGFTMESGETNTITYAYVWARAEDEGNDAQALLFDACEVVTGHFDDCFSSISDISLGLEDDETLARLSIGPNPAEDLLSIDLTDTDQSVLRMDVVNLSGQVITTELPNGIGTQTLDISALSPGLYLLNLHMANGALLGTRFVKQ